MNSFLIPLVVGARPNFIKIAPIVRQLDMLKTNYRLIHTGQHHDTKMNDIFFSELGIPEPNQYLHSTSNTPIQQISKIMINFENECLANPPSMILVVGDVNSTLACSIVAKKLNIKLAHVEAGLRSGDREMPEEINRIITDSISDLFFVTEPSGVINLLNEGHCKDKIHYVGNVMIDNLLYQKAKLDNMTLINFPTLKLKNELKKYAIVTLHRPSNVDNFEVFNGIADSLNEISKSLPIIFPVHPRTRKNIKKFNIIFNNNIFLIDPLSYLEFLNLWKDSEVVLTDSGGLQEETSALGIRCITIRNNTERPVTIEKGTNTLAGNNPSKIIATFKNNNKNKPCQIELWDGLSALRIANLLIENGLED